MKIKIKIVLTLLILIFSVNNVYGEMLDYGEITDLEYTNKSLYLGVWGGAATVYVSKIYVYQSQNYQSGLSYMYVDLLGTNFVGGLKSTYDSYFEGVELKEGTQVIAEGKIGYYKKPDGEYRLWIWFDADSWDYTGTGTKHWDITGHTASNFAVNSVISGSGFNTPSDPDSIKFAGSNYFYGTFVHYKKYSFKNTYYTNITGGLYQIHYDRSITGYSGQSKLVITDSIGTELLNETVLKETTLNLAYYNDNIPYTLYTTNSIENSFTNQLLFESSFDVNALRIEVDNIDIGDNIIVSYFNINDLRDNPLKYENSDYATCDLNIQILADRGYFNELIYQDMIIDETDDIFYYSSDTLTPGTYYAQINRNLAGLSEYAVRSTFVISEPLNYSITVNPDKCYVGDNINIIYKSLNQSTLSVYDDNDKLIDNWLNVQGQSQKVYQVPPDYEYNNAYSNWYVMLNDTGNSSNIFRYNFTVDWKIYVEPEPTPVPTEPYFNESIEENINELKDGFNPIFELIFGISTIFVDNPDYNKDNVVDVNELSTWINSIVSIAIVIFLFILYKVYKRR